jgi:hypothetical protein
LKQWSKRRNIPIHFFKLVPVHPAGQMPAAVLAGRHESDDYFRSRVEEMNRRTPRAS